MLSSAHCTRTLKNSLEPSTAYAKKGKADDVGGEQARKDHPGCCDGKWKYRELGIETEM